MAKIGCLSPIFSALYLLKIVPMSKQSSTPSVDGLYELLTLQIRAKTVLIRPRTTYFSEGDFAR